MLPENQNITHSSPLFNLTTPSLLELESVIKDLFQHDLSLQATVVSVSPEELSKLLYFIKAFFFMKDKSFFEEIFQLIEELANYNTPKQPLTQTVCNS